MTTHPAVVGGDIADVDVLLIAPALASPRSRTSRLVSSAKEEAQRRAHDACSDYVAEALTRARQGGPVVVVSEQERFGLEPPR